MGKRNNKEGKSIGLDGNNQLEKSWADELTFLAHLLGGSQLASSSSRWQLVRGPSCLLSRRQSHSPDQGRSRPRTQQCSSAPIRRHAPLHPRSSVDPGLHGSDRTPSPVSRRLSSVKTLRAPPSRGAGASSPPASLEILLRYPPHPSPEVLSKAACSLVPIRPASSLFSTTSSNTSNSRPGPATFSFVLRSKFDKAWYLNYVTRVEECIVKIRDDLTSELDNLWHGVEVMREAFDFCLYQQVDISVAQGLGLQASSLVA